MKRNLLATKLISFLLVLVMVFSLIPTDLVNAKGTSEDTSELSTETEQVNTEEMTTVISSEEKTEESNKETSEEKEITEKTEEKASEEKTEAETEEKTEESKVEIKNDKEELVIFDHVYNNVDVSNIKTKELFVITSDNTVFTKNTNVVSNYDNAYVINCESVEEAQFTYSYYLDKVEFISDMSNVITLSDNEKEETDSSEKSEEDVADLTDINKESEDAIANLNTAVEELEQTIEEDKELDKNTGYEGYIALIDSGVDKNSKVQPDVSVSVVDEEPDKDIIKHGTKMLSYIKEENPDAKVISIKAFDGKTSNVANIYAAIQYAIEAKVSVINLSFTGADIEENAIIKDIIKEAVKNKITVIGAAGNNSESSKLYIPGNVEEVITVGAVNEDGTLYKTSNFDADLYVVATSTSEATARYSGIFAGNIISDKVFQKTTDNVEEATKSDATEMDATETDATELPIDTDKIDFSKLETVNFKMGVKYLIIDKSFGINTINDVYSEEGNNVESFIHQISTGPEVYNIDDTYYAVKLDLAKNKNISDSITDCVFANGNDYGEVVTDNVYIDRKNYVAIFKKDAFDKKDGNFSDGQVQVLVPAEDNMKYPVQINYFNKNNKSIGSETVSVNLLETLDIDLSNNINNISEIRLNDEKTGLIKSEDYDIEGTDLKLKITSDNYYKINIYLNTEDTFIVAHTTSSSKTVNMKDVSTSSVRNITDGYSTTISGEAIHGGSSGTLYNYDWGETTQISNIAWRLKFKFLGKSWDLPAICAHLSNNTSGRYSDASSRLRGYGDADIHIHCVDTSTSGNYDYYYFIAYTDRPVCTPNQAAATYFAVRVQRGSYLYSKKVAEDKSTALRNVVFVVEDKNGNYIGYAKSSVNATANISNVYKAAAVENAQWDDSNFQTTGGGVNVSVGTTLKLAEKGYPLYECLVYDGGTHHNILGNQLAKNNGINSNYGKCVRNTAALTVNKKYMYIGNSKIYRFTVKEIDSKGNITVDNLYSCSFTVNGGLSKDSDGNYEWGSEITGRYKTLLESALHKTSNGHWYVSPIAKVDDEIEMFNPKTFTIATKAYSSDPKRSLLVNSTNEFSFYIYKVSKGYEKELGNASFVVYKTVDNIKNYIGETGYTTDLAKAKKFKTNANGVTGFCDTWITNTTHYAEEIEAPVGYKKLTNSIKLTINTSGISDDITNDTVIDDITDAGFAYTKITNSPVDKYIAIKKTDLNGNAIPNVKFNITKDSYSNESMVIGGQTVYVPKTGWQHNGQHKVNYASSVTLDKTSGVTDANGILVVKISGAEPDEEFPVTFTEVEPTDANVKANVWNYKDENNKYPNQGYKISYFGPGYGSEQGARGQVSSATVKNKNTVKAYIQKVSSVPSYTNGNPNYDLTGAQYTIYADANCTRSIGTVTTDKNGKSEVKDVTEILNMQNGVRVDTKFWVKETKKPNKGYLIDPTVHEVTIKANNELQKFEMKDIPVTDPISLTIKKTDTSGDKNRALDGTKFVLKYYAADISNILSLEALNRLTPTKTIELTTIKNEATGASEAKVSEELPLGYFVLEEKEVTDGYTLGQFKVYLNGDESKDITNDLRFVSDHIINADGSDGGRKTWYPNDAKTYAELATKGTEVNSADFRLEWSNTPIRGNIELTKVREDNDEPVEGVKFSIISELTGETHYIYTNKDGYATTKTDVYGKHMNYYDDKADYDKNITDATVFFIKDQNNQPYDFEKNPLDQEGVKNPDALPYGIYTVKEERCAANKDFQLERPYTIAITTAGEMVTVYDEDAEETQKKIYNVLKPNIHTLAFVDNTNVEAQIDDDEETKAEANIKSKTLAQKGGSVDYTNQTIKDEVTYNKLRADSQYTLVAELMIVDKNGNVEPYMETVGDEKVAYMRFKDFKTPVSYKKSIYNISDTVTVDLDKVDPTGLEEEQKKLVVYETLYYGDIITKKEDIPTGDAVKQYPEYKDIDDMWFFPLEHKDPADTFQTVKPADIHTTVMDNVSKDHIAHTSVETTLTDRVYYSGLTPGKKYLVTGQLEVKNSDTDDWKTVKYDPTNPDADADGFVYGTEVDTTAEKPVYTLKDADGNPVKAEPVEFTATESDGYVDITFKVDSSALEGKEVVAFEELKYKDITLAIHADLSDEDETVHYPKFKTTTRNSLVPIIIEGQEDSAKEVSATKTASFIDTIHYTNLIANRTYKAKGVLMNKADGKPLKDAAGNPIEAEATFTTPKVSEVVNDKTPNAKDFTLEDGTEMDMAADNAIYRVDGDVDVKFEGFDFTNLANITGVVFEEIFLVTEDGEFSIGEHKDINDVDQFISIIEIHTNATDQETGVKVVPENSETTILDTVTYKHCIPGKKYKLVATLVAKNDKSGTYKDGETIKNEDGSDVKVEFEFTPTTTDGEVVVPIKFNTKLLKNMQTVVFEDMYNEYGFSVAVHNDLKDDNQTVDIPGGHTTAKDNATDDEVARADADIKIIDTVYYENLRPGVEYTVTGTLYSKKTKAPIKSGENEVTSSTTFTPTKSSGTVDVVFKVNTKYLKGATLVVFEEMKVGEVTVFTHADIDDEAQTVHIPEIGTKATVDGKKEVSAVSTVEIIDKVTYKNLVPKKKYTLTGVLMNKETGKKLKVNGKDVTSSVTFTPKEPNGSINMTFKFNASGLSGDVVVFETLLHNDVTVATHKDIDSEEQTVKLKESARPKTGTPIIPLAIAGGVVVVLIGLFIFLKKRNKITR